MIWDLFGDYMIDYLVKLLDICVLLIERVSSCIIYHNYICIAIGKRTFNKTVQTDI